MTDTFLELLDSAPQADSQPSNVIEPGELQYFSDAGKCNDTVDQYPESSKADSSWPDPQPLTVKIDSQPYPLDALPGAIRTAVTEVLGFTKSPVPLAASSALSALSLAIQAHYDVKRAEKLTGPTSLFLLTIADSGERKSTCDGFFTTAIRDYEMKQHELAKPEQKNYQAAIDGWGAKRGAIKDIIRQLTKEGKPTDNMENDLRELEHTKPKPPIIPRLLYTDATPEALAYELAKQWPSGGVVSAEAGIVFGGHGMGKDSVMRNLGLLNILWDGGHLNIDRRTSESFTVGNARLTMALQVQEATLRSFFDRSGDLARGSGFLARFLIAWPESTQGHRSFTEAPADWPALAAFNQRIKEILTHTVSINEAGILNPQLLSLSPQAKDVWITFHDAIERQLANGGELYDVRDVASKAADNAARLATLFHVFEGTHGAISAAAFRSASRIVAWHLHEARRFFGELAQSTELTNAARLDRWLINYCRKNRTPVVARREIQRNVTPVHLRQKAALEDAIKELVEIGRIRYVKEPSRKEIHVNPALIQQEAA